METCFVGIHLNVHDRKGTKSVEFVESADHVENVQVQDIHVGPRDTYDTPPFPTIRPDVHLPASLLTLPVEIRLQIYEMAYDATFLHSKLRWKDGLTLHLQGTSGSSSQDLRLSGSPFTLLRVCRALYAEVVSMLPPLSLVALHFDDFTEVDMKRWLGLLSDSQIAQLRSFWISGWTTCQLKQPLYADGHLFNCQRYRRFTSTYPIACTGSCQVNDQDENVIRAQRGLCDRSLKLDLNAFDHQFQAERFERTVKQPKLDNSSESSHREFHKACYLLRVLDGCVERSAPIAHPAGRNSQCGQLDAVEASLASFVSDEGDVVVDRGRILDLWRAGMGR